MKKMILLGTGNFKGRYRYEFEKENDFKSPFLIFLETLGFDKKEACDWFRYYIDDEPKELEIKKVEDSYYHTQNKKFDIDVFIGKRKIILIIRTKQREQLVNSINKYVELESEKHFKQKRKERKHKSVPKVK